MLYKSAALLGGLAIVLTGAPEVLAQGGGGLGGAGSFSSGSDSNRGISAAGLLIDSGFPLPPERALNYITVEGTATLRVKPTQIRLVLAVTSQGETAQECQTASQEKVAALRRQWQQLDIPPENIVEDFIAVLPTYRWDPEERDGTKVLVEHRDGYRMQTNLHLAVPTEEEAMEAIRQAFALDVSDIITFDYWADGLDEKKREARKLALKTAREKAETLLSAFDQKPAPINVQEFTTLRFPRSNYRTFTNALEEEVRNWSSSTPRIRAFRPKLTFYDDVDLNADVRPDELAMHPEISVISQVRLYYESPGRRPSDNSASADE